MVGSRTLKNQWRGVKRKLDTPIGMMSFFAAFITVCSFFIGFIEWLQSDLQKSSTVQWFTRGSGAQAVMLILYALAAVWIWRRCYRILLHRRLRYRFDCSLWLGLGLQLILALPTGLAQMLLNKPRLTMADHPLWTRLLIPLSHWPFNVGGVSVLALHHWSLVQWSRLWAVDPSEVVARMAYLTVLTGLQGLLLAWLFTVRYRRVRGFKDWGLGIGCGLFLLNSLALLWCF